MAQTSGSRKSSSNGSRTTARGPKKSTKEEISEVEAFLQEELPGKLESAPARLADKMDGTILLKLDDKLHYLCDGVKKAVEKLGTRTAEADCTVSLRASDFIRISKGVLNPQIAMLSEKIAISGKTPLAVYLFNLVAPSDAQ